MFLHSTALHPLYKPSTPSARTTLFAAANALVAPVTWHLCLMHSDGVYTNEVATLAHPPAMQWAIHRFSSGRPGRSLPFTSS